ncbi:MAG: flagellar hook-associated family protein [Hyphomicrobiales bacterium]|nr:flagellar hook-associated family protein [Hyphomicrobiales bacterium]
MNTSFISSMAITNATKLSIQKAQAELVQVQKEVASGRHADVGLALGTQTGRVVSLRQEYARIDTILGTNTLVRTHLEASQASLQSLSDTAGEFISTLLAARGGEVGAGNAVSVAESNLQSFTDMANASINGQSLFAGINTDILPVSNYYETPISAAKQAVDDAFFAEFGMDQSDPAVSTIPPTAMQIFIGNTFASLFEDPAWSDWSSASDQNISSRISTYEIVETSTNTNEPAFRRLAAAYTMVADLGGENMSHDTFVTVMDTAIQYAQEAVNELAATQSSLGVAQHSIASADDRMTIQKDIITGQINTLEEVDPYEASTRLNDIVNQIELSYALTGRINQLSLLNYL